MENFEHEEMLLLYRVFRDNQEFYMNQQWRVIYYIALLFGAIFVAAKNTTLDPWAWYTATGIVFIIGTTLLCILEISLSESREKLDCIMDEKLLSIKGISGMKNSSKAISVFLLLCIIHIFLLIYECNVIHYLKPSEEIKVTIKIDK